MEHIKFQSDFDSLSRNLVSEVITFSDKRHVRYGDHTYRHVRDRNLKDGVEKSYWACINKKECKCRIHTIGPVVVKIVNLHTCTHTAEENLSDSEYMDLPILDDLSDCLTDINEPSLLDTKDGNLLQTQNLLSLLNNFHAAHNQEEWKN